MANYAQQYFEALKQLVGRREDLINRVPNAHGDGLPPAHALFFRDWPRPGVLTAFTVGLALGRHVTSLDAHVELLASMETNDISWGAAVAFLGEQCRRHVELQPGVTLNMKEALASNTSMTGFIVSKPTLWAAPPVFELSDRRVVILEARPLYPAELAFARVESRERLLEALGGPNYDACRPQITPLGS